MRIRAQSIDGTPVTVLAAAPLAAIAGPMREALITIGLSLAALGVALVAATVLLVRLGLRPLRRLQTEVADVRAGRAARLSEDQPHEVRPLVSEMNVLLEQNAVNLVRARQHVANLAHGLKTPLATLSLAVNRSPDDQRATLQTLVGLIDRRIRHHLGRARAAALDGPARSQTKLCGHLRDLTDVMMKLHAAKAVRLVLECPEGLMIACEPQDVDEILGNLLDNAFKWTRSEVRCRASAAATKVVIAIADDGPGLAAQDIDHVLRPGQRLDEAVPGFGFGLSIARELAELYAGTLALAPGNPGLTVTLTLPRAF
jgi:signal transduction histidine kinase